jgi:hypothetical protein
MKRKPPFSRPAQDRYDDRSIAPDTRGYTISHRFAEHRSDRRACVYCGMTREHPNHR